MADYNLAQLEALINTQLMVALDNTMDRLLIELQNIIESEVYGWESPSEYPWSMDSLGRGNIGITSGQRTGEFLESWQTHKSKLLGLMAEAEISQAIDVMNQIFSGGHMVHEDRENLAGIINSGSGYNFGQCYVARPYWDKFIIYVTLNLSNIFESECIKLGLPITKATIL